MIQKYFFLMILIYCAAVFVFQSLFAQDEGEIVIIHEQIGELIDLEERNTYKLFMYIESFQSAVLRKITDGKFVFSVNYLDEATGEQKIKSVFQTEKEIKNIAEYIENIHSGEKEEEKNSGSVYNYEKERIRTKRSQIPNWQLTLKSDRIISGVSLVYAENQSLGVSVGGQSTLAWVPVDSIEKIIYIRQKKFAGKVAAGALIGGVAGFFITNAATRENEFMAGLKGIVGGLSGAFIGGCIGGLGGAVTGADVYDLSQRSPAGKELVIDILLYGERKD